MDSDIEVGKRYLFVLDFGRGIVGRVLRLSGFNDVVLTEAHFITRCGQETDWGRFVRNGPGPEAIVNAIGPATINMDKRIWSAEFSHALPKSR